MPLRFDKYTRFALLLGESTFQSQAATDEQTSVRRLLALVPSIAGALEREQRHVKYSATQLPTKILWTHQFDRNDGLGVFTRHFFVATATKLYKDIAGVLTEVTDVGTLAAVPVAKNLDNLMHFSDGATSWLFDGTSWKKRGFDIPLSAPAIDVASAGTLNITSNRYYWFAWADETAGRRHESSSSVRSAGTGAITSKQVKVRQQAGTASATSGSTAVSRTREDFLAQHVGMKVYIDGVDEGTIASRVAGTKAAATLTSTGAFSAAETVVVGGKTYTFRAALTPTANEVLIGGSATESHRNLKAAVNQEAGAGTLYAAATTQNPDVECTSATATTNVFAARYTGTAGNSIVSTETCANASFGGATFASGTDSTATLAANAPTTKTAQLFVIAPPRATHWHIYASEAETSNVGLYLATVPVATMEYIDQSPFVGTVGSVFTSTSRPISNDPPFSTLIMEVHKRRLWQRRGTFKNFIGFTVYEEGQRGVDGRREESMRGVDDNTVSPAGQVNEFSYPDESDEVRAMKSWGDALYIATEDEIIPLYGESYDDFALSQITSFVVGVAGRFAMEPTPFGLAFVSYDRKVYLYPSQGVPANADVTATLIEIGRPLRTKLEDIKPADLDNVRLRYYNYGRRNWLVLSFQDTGSVYHTWIFDFETRGWFELSRGVSSLDVWEVSAGKRVLLGGGTDGFLWVLDDLTGTYAGSGNYAAATFKPALIDFGDASKKHIPRYIEFELSDEAMAADITLNYWLDPEDVDAPGAGTAVQFGRVSGSNLYRGFFRRALCNRLLVEFTIAASANNNKMRGLSVAALPVGGLIKGTVTA